MRSNNMKNRVYKNRAFMYTDGLDEATYFTKLSQIYRQDSNYVLNMINKEGKSKLDLVNDIITDIKENHRDSYIGDIFCAVTDYDFVIGAGTKDNSVSAKQKADSNNIGYYLSNDSWELWILLHFEDVSSPLSRDEINKRLKDKYSYDKKDKKSKDNFINNMITKDLISVAVGRSNILCKKTKNDDFKNPYTNVYELVEKLFIL